MKLDAVEVVQGVAVEVVPEVAAGVAVEVVPEAAEEVAAEVVGEAVKEVTGTGMDTNGCLFLINAVSWLGSTAFMPPVEPEVYPC